MKKNCLQIGFSKNTNKKYFAFFLLSGITFASMGQAPKSQNNLKKPKIDQERNLAYSNFSSKADLLSSGKDFVEQGETGFVNWTKQTINGEGFGLIDTVKNPGIVQAKLYALMEAETAAQSNLRDVLLGISVDGQNNVQNYLKGSEENMKQVDALLKSAVTVGSPTYVDGKCKVVKRIPLFNSGLAPIVVDDAIARSPEIVRNPFLFLDVSDKDQAAKAPVELPGDVFLLLEGPFQPNVFPSVCTEEESVIFNFTAAYLEKKAKVPAILSLRKSELELLKNKKRLAVLSVYQGKNGNYIPTESAKQRIASWKVDGKTVAGLVRNIIVEN